MVKPPAARQSGVPSSSLTRLPPPARVTLAPMPASPAPLARRALAPLLALSLLTPACSSTPAGALAQPPEYAPKGEAKCGVTKSQAEPLIVEWPSAARGKLETQARRGVVAVRYVGCEMQVLAGCRAPGGYKYAPMTRKRDRLSIRNEDDLYASIPVYAAAFEGKLRSAGELNVTMTLVGRFEAERQIVRKDELSGDECAGATHVITALTAGAFKFFAGADAEAGGTAGVAGTGVGARSAAAREILREDGDDTECAKASRADQEPPEGCGALLRVEVVPLGEAKERDQVAGAGAAGSAEAPASGIAPEKQCKGGEHFEAGKGCVADVAPLPPVPNGISEGEMVVTGKISQIEVQRVLRESLGDVKRCHELALGRSPRLSGRVNVNLTIGSDGRAKKVTSAGSSMLDEAMHRCVLRIIEKKTFPVPGEGTATVVYPLTFSAPPTSPDLGRKTGN